MNYKIIPEDKKKNSLSCAHNLHDNSCIINVELNQNKFTSICASIFAKIIVRRLALVTGCCNKLRVMRDPVSKHHYKTRQFIYMSIKYYDISSNKKDIHLIIFYNQNLSK